MAVPSSLNPSFKGQVKSNSYEAEHGNGISTTTIALSGTTTKYFFGSASIPNNFRGTITGVWISQLVATSQTVTVKSDGNTVCTFTGATTAGLLHGPNAALANTAININGSITAVSNSTVDVSLVTITYKTDLD